VNVGLARVQFGATTIYHFLFVPVTICLAFLVAILQTIWHRSGDPEQRRLVRFFGTLLLINVAIGVVTGLVQEFEFGMNWSAYSRFVGDVFGAPLAMEGLAAFFLESTFLGLWIFGWDRLPKRIHLACIWLVAIGTVLSAAFIMAANSWMQHPVGYTINSTTGRPQLSNIADLFTNPVFLWGYTHVLLASAVTGSLIMLAVSAWHLRRSSSVEAFGRTARISLVVLLPAIVLAMFVGSELGVVEAKYQPMKIAAAEAQWNTCQPCSFSLFQIGGGKEDQTPTQILEIPHLLSLLATNHWNGQVEGLNQINAQYQQYGPGNYVPNVFVQYWSMRVMAYIAALVLLLALWGGWAVWRKRLERSRWFLLFATWFAIAPFLMNTAGWFLTENGRQPWIVQGLMKTSNGVSPTVSSTWIWITLVLFILVYGVFAVVDGILMVHYGRKQLSEGEDGESGAEGVPEGGEPSAAETPVLTY
jgi:cytochrome bd-type quinol oxidase subunit 1